MIRILPFQTCINPSLEGTQRPKPRRIYAKLKSDVEFTHLMVHLQVVMIFNANN